MIKIHCFKPFFTLLFVSLALLLQLRPMNCSKEAISNSGEGKAKNVSLEAKIIAMDFTENLLPPENLSVQISEDLIKIRKSFSNVANLTYHGRWYPGELITEVTLTQDEKQKINESEFGPLLYIGQSENYNLTLLIFSSLYNPETLAVIIKSRFNIECQPFHRRTPVVITYEDDSSDKDAQTVSRVNSRKYTFEKRYGGCHQEPSLCKKRHFWVFMLSGNGEPTLENEYDAPKNHYALTQY